MAISDRITSIEEHIKESYQELEGIGIDTTGVNNNLENIPKLIDGYWETLPKVTGEGTSITLDNTKEGKMKINLKGNTSQEGTPTPETPQDIHVVSGNNSIEVCGKNLLPTNSLTPTYNTTTTLIDFGKDKTFDSVTLNFIFNGSYSQVTNVAMFDLKTNDNTHNYLTPDTFGLRRDTLYTNQQLSTTITNVTFRYLIVYFMTNNYNNFSANSTMTNIQLEKSSTATPYEPYQSQSYPINLGSIELCKIGDYQDSIVKDNGKWYLNKQIGKVVLDGSENWTISGKTYYINISEKRKLTSSSSNGLISNYFKDTTATSSANVGLGEMFEFFNPNVPNNNVGFNYDDVVGGVANFKTWLSSNNVEVRYILATPTYTEITDSTLISQLEALKKARSYNEQTNISQNNNDLQFIINATALKEMA